MAKTFNDINIGDFLYEIDSSKCYIVKVTEISKKGKKTMLVKTDNHLFDVRVDVDTNKMTSSTLWYKWFINKEDVLNYIKEKLDNIESTYKREKERCVDLLKQIQDAKDI